MFKNAIKKIQRFLYSKPINTNESYINSEMIYNAKYNFMILISYSKDYSLDAIEFLTACSACGNANESPHLNIKYIHSSYEEDTNTKDEDGYPIILTNERNYLLLGGADEDYKAVYNSIDNLSNSFIDAITTEIYQYRCSTMYNDLIESSVLNNKFKFKGIEPAYDKFIVLDSDKGYDDAKLILSKLPKGFTGQNLLKFIRTYNIYDHNPSNYTVNVYTAYDYLYSGYINNLDGFKYFVTNTYADMYKVLIKNGSDEVYKNCVGPQYLVMDDEAMPGSISDENLSEMFREKYERFTGVLDNDIEYEDIDEVIGENDEEQNIRKTDKMVEITEGDEE